MIRITAVPTLLHGLYDTLLKKDMNAAALLTAGVSFVRLMFLIQRYATKSASRRATAA